MFWSQKVRTIVDPHPYNYEKIRPLGSKKKITYNGSVLDLPKQKTDSNTMQ